jgi:hypothetical protein
VRDGSGAACSRGRVDAADEPAAVDHEAGRQRKPPRPIAVALRQVDPEHAVDRLEIFRQPYLIGVGVDRRAGRSISVIAGPRNQVDQRLRRNPPESLVLPFNAYSTRHGGQGAWRRAERTRWRDWSRRSVGAAQGETVFLRATCQDGVIAKEVCDVLLAVRGDAILLSLKSQENPKGRSGMKIASWRAKHAGRAVSQLRGTVRTIGAQPFWCYYPRRNRHA